MRLTLKRNPILNVYNINSHRLDIADKHTDLGIIIDSKLLFTFHVNSAVSNSRKILGMIKRFGKGLSVSALITVYIAFVRTKLEYASVIWNSIGKGSSDKIEAVQRKFFKYLCFVDKRNHEELSYADMCALFKLPCLADRRTYFDLVFLFKSANSVFDCQSFFGLHVPGRRTRQAMTFNQPGGRVKFSQLSLFNRLPTLYNNVYSNLRIFNVTLPCFKSSAKKACW
jgi:hypothetical protein